MVTKQTDLTNKQRTWIMVPLLIGGFIALLNETLLNVAFPRLTADFHVSTSTIQWLATGYMLVIGISVPVVAFLLENIKTNSLYMIAMLLFSVGTVFCGLSQNFTMLLISRIVQGVGTGMLVPIMMNTILAIYPPEKRGSAMGASMLVVVFAPAIGPTLSGLILQHLNWHWLFFLILPIAVLAMVIAAFHLTNISRLTKPKIDIISVILSTIGFGGLILGICSIETMGLFNAVVIVSMVCGIGGIFLYSKRQLWLKQPMLELKTFRYPMFSCGTVILLLSFMIPFSTNIILPTYFQEALHLSPLLSGMALLPGGIIAAIVTPLSGRLFDRIGAKPLMITGFSILAIAMFLLSHISLSSGLLMVVLLHILTFLGFALASTPVQVNTLNQLPRQYHAHGVAITNTAQQLASAIGSSLFIGLMGAVQGAYLARFPKANSLQQNAAIIEGVHSAFTAAFIMVLIALFISFFIKRSSQFNED